MFRIYEKYLIKKFLKFFINITFLFFALVIVLSVFEELSFFKNSKSNFLLPYILTLLNAPMTLFEIIPFIFLLSTQLFFYDIFKKEELSLLKFNGLSNLKIIKLLFFLSLFIGVLTISVYYNLASKLNYYYTDIKNFHSKDNKYLAAVTDSGLWLKDEMDESIFITKAKIIKDHYLIDVIINEFDLNFLLKNTIQSSKINIIDKKWIIYNPIQTSENISEKKDNEINFKTNFDIDKISSLFSNVSTLNIIELFNLKKDYEGLGYSSDEIRIQIFRLFSEPLFYGLMCVFSSIIMFKLKKNNSIFFLFIIGILISVMIYYFNFVFSSLGNSGKLPAEISIFLPMLIMSIIVTIGLLTVNEN